MKRNDSSPSATTVNSASQYQRCQVPTANRPDIENWCGSESPTAAYVVRWMTCHTSYGRLRFTAMIDVIATTERVTSPTTLKKRLDTPRNEANSEKTPIESWAA